MNPYIRVFLSPDIYTHELGMHVETSRGSSVELHTEKLSENGLIDSYVVGHFDNQDS